MTPPRRLAGLAAAPRYRHIGGRMRTVRAIVASCLAGAYRYGGPSNLSGVIPVNDPKRTDQFGAGTFSKAALSN